MAERVRSAGPQWVMLDRLLAALAQQLPGSPKQLMQAARELMGPGPDRRAALRLLKAHASQVCQAATSCVPACA